MIKDKYLLLLGCLLQAHLTLSWMCSQDVDCSSTQGALCLAGNCVCPKGQESVFGGTVCVDRSPYYTWPCVQDHQCSRLVTNFECRKDEDAQEGHCFCREGFHYLLGRCWETSAYEAPCLRDENCIGTLMDPFSVGCDETTKLCACADGYYRRQRGECRKIGYAVGDGCVLDEDCQFERGLCNINTFSCYQAAAGTASTLLKVNATETLSRLTEPVNLLQRLRAKPTVIQNGANVNRQDGGETPHFAPCDAINACTPPFVCSMFGDCVCPIGYYASDDGSMCYAELGSPSTEEQCVGLFAEVRNGICTCMTNFYFEENMRDCVKVVRNTNDVCVADNNCHTFGVASRCGDPSGPWEMRTCECIPELAVWDPVRMMCRIAVGVGETCLENSDCLAGNQEIDCVINSEGEGVCTCPADTTEMDGLCLTSGLVLGESCQASPECTGTANTGCYDGVCACSEGYQDIDGFCAPTMGGACREDSDCVVDGMVCVMDDGEEETTCQCQQGTVEDDNICWPLVTDSTSVCNVTAQCVPVMGAASSCVEERCVCAEDHHYRDGRCWPRIGLFEGCARSSECYLQDISERVECRNSLCQCSFNYPYSEQLGTCISESAASTATAGLLTFVAVLYHVLSL